MPEIVLPPPELASSMGWHMLLHTLLPTLAAPALLTLIVYLLGREHAPLAAALGITVGVGLGLWLNEKIALTTGTATWNRLPWAALTALWAGRLARLPDLQPTAGWLLRGAVAFGTAWLVIPQATRTEVDWLAPLFAAVILAEWALLERLTADPPGGGVLVLLALTFFVAGVVLIHAGSQGLMDVALVFACALFGLGLAGWWFQADVGGAIPAVAVMLPGLLLMGQQTTSVPTEDLTWKPFALTALAPLVLAETLPLRAWVGWRLRLVQLALVLIPLALAFYLALLAGPLPFE